MRRRPHCHSRSTEEPENAQTSGPGHSCRRRRSARSVACPRCEDPFDPSRYPGRRTQRGRSPQAPRTMGSQSVTPCTLDAGLAPFRAPIQQSPDLRSFDQRCHHAGPATLHRHLGHSGRGPGQRPHRLHSGRSRRAGHRSHPFPDRAAHHRSARRHPPLDRCHSDRARGSGAPGSRRSRAGGFAAAARQPDAHR